MRLRPVFLALVLVGLLGSQQSILAGQVFDRVMKSGVIRFGVPYNRIPQGFLNSNGEWVGFEIDLAKEIARRIGRKADLVKVNERNWRSLLSSGTIDAALCRIRHRRSLESAFDLTVSYFFDYPCILAIKDTVKGPADLKGKKVAAVQGSSGERLAMQILRSSGDPEAEKNVVSYPDRPSCFMAVAREKAAAWIDSGLVLLEYASRKPGRFELIPASNAVEGIAVALAQDDSAWRDLLNLTIQDMAANGSLKKIYDKWFGPDSSYGFPMKGAVEIWPD